MEKWTRNSGQVKRNLQTLFHTFEGRACQFHRCLKRNSLSNRYDECGGCVDFADLLSCVANPMAMWSCFELLA